VLIIKIKLMTISPQYTYLKNEPSFNWWFRYLPKKIAGIVVIREIKKYVFTCGVISPLT